MCDTCNDLQLKYYWRMVVDCESKGSRVEREVGVFINQKQYVQ